MPLRYALAALFLLAAASPPAVSAQVCPDILQSEISLSDVRSGLFNTGVLLSRFGGDSYVVPKDGTASPIIQAMLWIGGTVDGEERIAAGYHGDLGEFRPGPLGDDGEPLPGGCDAYNRIYRVSAPELAAFEAGNPPSSRLAEWPVGLGAPAIDVDGAPIVPTSPEQTLDLDAGERPVVYGTETAFWVMNDLAPRTVTASAPIGIEVRATAFLVNAPGESALDQGSFYRYEVINKSGQEIEDLRVAMWVDYDLGDFGDDYIGSDSARGLGFVYNGDEDDEVSNGGYGVPPAAGVDVLSGGWGHVYYENRRNSQTGIPVRGEPDGWLNIIRGTWRDGTPISRGGIGYNPGSTDVTRWHWDGDPVTQSFWTEDNADGQGTAREPNDRVSTILAPPTDLAPGASSTVDFAVLFAQGTDRLNSVTELRAASDLVQARYDDGSLFETTSGDLGLPPLAAPALLSPADGFMFTPPETARLEWAAVGDASEYRVQVNDETDFTGRSVVDEIVTGLTTDVALDALLENTGEAFFWRVTPRNGSGPGPTSGTRSFTYPFTFDARTTTLSNGQFAFVEVTGPGGADPCADGAESTFGCDEVGGNAVYLPEGSDTLDANGTGIYALTSLSFGPESTLGPFAPRDFEIRFTGQGSIGYHLFNETPSNETHRVPFEIWDVGIVAPGEANDPADDVRLIPVLLSDGNDGDERGTCAFNLDEVPVGAPNNPLGVTLSDRIYAYYPVTTYADFDAAASQIVDASDGACYDDDDGALGDLIDRERGRPIQRVVVADLVGSGLLAPLEGTVIRFYTNDPQPVADETAPTASALALTVAPNPSRGGARVAFTLPTASDVRVRIVDTLGRTVAVLADGARAAGPHAASVPRGLAAGVYVVTIEADGERAARTLTVIR